jgi:peptide deformylase
MKLPDPSSLRIVMYPDPFLKKKASAVEEFGDGLAALAARMLELMREAKGVGLAAPQVGVGIRLFVCSETGEAKDDLICVNPRLVELNGADEKPEGCLSIPEVSVTMRRAIGAVIEAFDVRGKPFQIRGTDLCARIWQHEVDHLDGRLITDAMSETDEIANRKALKQLEEQYRRARRR